jgi:DNA mismatch repair protein MutS
VAAQGFQFMPFRNILTRLSGMDNMYKGQGSFSVEISELRDITKRCTEHSIVLGDELCRGTENTAAIGLVAGSIVHMSDKNANFIFATHLHDLPKLPEISQLENRIRIKHLAVKRDPMRNTIEYTRILQDGPGDANYGIDVAMAHGLPHDIIIIARSVAKRMIGVPETLSSLKTSHFNAEKITPHLCEVCQKAFGEHTHHLYEQNTADARGIIDNEFHKNSLHNLVYLCRNCHDDIHNRKTLIIQGYVQTSEGTKLKWERIGSPPTVTIVKPGNIFANYAYKANQAKV